MKLVVDRSGDARVAVQEGVRVCLTGFEDLVREARVQVRHGHEECLKVCVCVCV